MPESLPIALALVALAVAGWDCARRYMQLAHGRMLSADRSQTFERAITTLSTQANLLADDASRKKEQIAEIGSSLDDVRRRFYDIEKQEPLSRLGVLESELIDLKRSFGVAYGAQDQVISKLRESLAQSDLVLAEHGSRLSDYGHALTQDAQRFHGLTDWQKTCERSIELLQADIDKRDKAITNVAEEVAGLQRQQALALMGIAKTPKHGYAPGGPK